jgi:hypothetical protein
VKPPKAAPSPGPKRVGKRKGLSRWLPGAAATLWGLGGEGADLREDGERGTVGDMPTAASKKLAVKRPRAAAPAARKTARKLSAAVLPLPSVSLPAGPLGAAEIAAMGVGVDFAIIKRVSGNRLRRAR